MSRKEIFADGVRDIFIGEDTVRVEFVSQTRAARDGQPALEDKLTLVMTLKGFARLHGAVNRGMKALIERGDARPVGTRGKED